eukprot:360851-Chlamydomonas_euryale.AAC.8
MSHLEGRCPAALQQFQHYKPCVNGAMPASRAGAPRNTTVQMLQHATAACAPSARSRPPASALQTAPRRQRRCHPAHPRHWPHGRLALSSALRPPGASWAAPPRHRPPGAAPPARSPALMPPRRLAAAAAAACPTLSTVAQAPGSQRSLRRRRRRRRLCFPPFRPSALAVGSRPTNGESTPPPARRAATPLTCRRRR